ncbi:MAG TPA: hypothetical protein VGX25_13410 [Actinophytocola sp.]|uniref:hypothetical protein n=1 Tax=Actinophytocola sp. TaxID=1872138 RepID=UPI002DDCAD05|nr:hypothetical protein [Actinophytocola sp.]HEV2780381.1 hypothetical protein [Actinophytocola sp.]
MHDNNSAIAVTAEANPGPDRTPNARLADLAAATHRFLTRHASLPAISHCRQQDGMRDVIGDIELLLAGDGGNVADAAIWARALDTAVRFRRHPDYQYVDVSVWTEADGHQVRIWDHMDPLAAYDLLASLGLELTEVPVRVDPARLLELPPVPAVDGQPREEAS